MKKNHESGCVATCTHKADDEASDERCNNLPSKFLPINGWIQKAPELAISFPFCQNWERW